MLPRKHCIPRSSFCRTCRGGKLYWRQLRSSMLPAQAMIMQAKAHTVALGHRAAPSSSPLPNAECYKLGASVPSGTVSNQADLGDALLGNFQTSPLQNIKRLFWSARVGSKVIPNYCFFKPVLPQAPCRQLKKNMSPKSGEYVLRNWVSLQMLLA